MPYESNKDLPDAVRNNLPDHLQTVWRKAFNSAHKQYKGKEEIAFKVAWSAVKKART